MRIESIEDFLARGGEIKRVGIGLADKIIKSKKRFGRLKDRRSGSARGRWQDNIVIGCKEGIELEKDEARVKRAFLKKGIKTIPQVMGKLN